MQHRVQVLGREWTFRRRGHLGGWLASSTGSWQLQETAVVVRLLYSLVSAEPSVQHTVLCMERSSWFLRAGVSSRREVLRSGGRGRTQSLDMSHVVLTHTPARGCVQRRRLRSTTS